MEGTERIGRNDGAGLLRARLVEIGIKGVVGYGSIGGEPVLYVYVESGKVRDVPKFYAGFPVKARKVGRMVVRPAK